MNPGDNVIFAELTRDHFDEIVQTLTTQFENIQFGRQGDDWIWIYIGEDKIEIDSFFSMELEVKGKYNLLKIANQIIGTMESSWIIQVFDPPKIDMTR